MASPVGNSRLAAFDLDGTLVDSWEDIFVSVQMTLESRGLPPVEPAYVKERIGLPASSLFGESGSRKHVDALVVEFRKRLEDVLGTHSRVFPGVTRGLESLIQGGWTCAVATNKPTYLAELALKRAGLSRYFVLVHGVDEPLRPKPAPDILDACLVRLGCTTGMMVGDTANDVIAAREAGLLSVLVRYPNAPQEPLAEFPDVVVNSIAELSGLELAS